MRKINENDFVDYTIIWNNNTFTVSKLSDALKKWKDFAHGTLYGNKPNGQRAVIDSR